MPPADFADAAAAEDDEVAAMFDLKLKKKKKKKKVETEDAGADGAGEEGGAGGEASEVAASSSLTTGVTDLDPPTYTYGTMLNRVVELLHQNNPEMLEKRKYTMKPPQLMRGSWLMGARGCTRAGLLCNAPLF